MDSSVECLVQRRIGLRYTFRLGSDLLTYSARDASGERTIEIPYESINLSQSAYVTLTATPLLTRLSRLLFVWLILAAALAVLDRRVAHLLLLACVPLAFAVPILRLTRVLSIKLKLFQLQPLPPGALGPMRVIDDDVGEEILSRISQARKAKLRRLYAEANLDADPGREIARLDWLKANEIITSEEWQLQVERVRNGPTARLAGDGVKPTDKPDALH